MLGCGGGKGRCGGYIRSCGERCREVCWGVGEVRGDGGVWGSVEGGVRKYVGVYGR